MKSKLRKSPDSKYPIAALVKMEAEMYTKVTMNCRKLRYYPLEKTATEAKYFVISSRAVHAESIMIDPSSIG